MTLEAVIDALAEAQQPQAALQALDAALQQAVGHRFLSVLVYHHAEGVAERIHSNRPELFPVGARKAFADAPTQRRVAESGKPYIGRDAAELRRDFPDHEKIFALGCESILNMPVLWRGRSLGQVNLLHGAGHYHDDHLTPVRVLSHLMIPVLLLTGTGGAASTA
ncbi:hypothetical protein BKE38_03925 [Pseudoroseomonas deserti]|uniref:GAF domain-containing protein n=1 Tax=Teichococcus deserti TaxID=1817963 RepID=A0A1V2H7D8_9PROT|nr:GAF domain-containing protein [Pseudoroseomonas deserti]ONG57869.1 hypothetical protein BKE38_03925 [Pseudoroseomonas deserti]